MQVYSLRVQKIRNGSQGLKEGCQQYCLLSGCSRGESISSSFPVSSGHLHFWLLASCSIPKACDVVLSPPWSTNSLVHSCLPFLLWKTLVITLGPSRDSGSSLSFKICWTASFTPPAVSSLHYLKYPVVLRIRMWTSLGGKASFCLPQTVNVETSLG